MVDHLGYAPSPRALQAHASTKLAYDPFKFHLLLRFFRPLDNYEGLILKPPLVKYISLYYQMSISFN